MQFYRGRSTKNEPRSFWVLTFIGIGIVVVTIVELLWFLGWGHELADPVHDAFPHAAIK